jgi:hypothetical protein
MSKKRQFIDEDIELLKDVQFRSYSQLYHCLFNFPKDRFLSSLRLLGLNKEFSKQIEVFIINDNKVFKSVYDLIASHFRYNYNRLITESKDPLLSKGLSSGFIGTGFDYEYIRFKNYPNLIDCLQTNHLKESNDDYNMCLKKNWVHYFNLEVLNLTYTNDLFTKAMIATVLGLVKNLNTIKDVISHELYFRYECYDWYFIHDDEKRASFEDHFDSIEETFEQDKTFINDIIMSKLKIINDEPGLFRI